MRIAVGAGLILLAGLVGASVYVVGALSGWWIPKRSAEALLATLEPHMAAYAPEGAGPFPVVLQFPGCGGLVDREGQTVAVMDDYAQAALAEGVGVIMVDSFSPRGLTRDDALELVCSGWRVRGAQRAADVLAAIQFARTLEWVDADRLALAGWSHGAWAIMDAMSMDFERVLPHGLTGAPETPLSGVQGLYLTYPYVGFITRTAHQGWVHTPRTHVVMAGDDDLALEADVRRAVAAMRASGAEVTTHVIAGVTHAFDEPQLEPGSRFQSSPEKAAEARAAYGSWLADTLGALDAPAAADSGVRAAANPDTDPT